MKESADDFLNNFFVLGDKEGRRVSVCGVLGLGAVVGL